MADKRLPLAMRPDGPLGKSFGWVMERMNAPAYRMTLKALAPEAGQSILEIGFGTGAFLERLAQSAAPRLLAGVDPAGTMLEVASARLRAHPLDCQLDLRQGTDRDLDWPDASFDRVAALHSFQFWESPESTLCRIRSLLAQSGLLCLCLRRHGQTPPDWLPNSLSRSPDETIAVVSLLAATGYTGVQVKSTDQHSVIVTAAR